MIFCDTSTVAKLYVPEKESAAVRRMLEAEDEVCASQLARLEMMGVFHRRLREGKWRRNEFQAAVRQFSSDEIGGFWTWLPLDQAVLDGATATYAVLPEDVFLRTADCLHLTTALRHRFQEIYTHDQHQMAAASWLGLNPISL